MQIYHRQVAEAVARALHQERHTNLSSDRHLQALADTFYHSHTDCGNIAVEILNAHGPLANHEKVQRLFNQLINATFAHLGHYSPFIMDYVCRYDLECEFARAIQNILSKSGCPTKLTLVKQAVRYYEGRSDQVDRVLTTLLFENETPESIRIDSGRVLHGIQRSIPTEDVVFALIRRISPL